MAKIISRNVRKPPQQINRILTLKEFWKKRNKILIIRKVGGLGDILMHRMIFEDFKLLMPSAEIHFACPGIYHDIIKDHPLIDKLLDSNPDPRNPKDNDLDLTQYMISYDTSSICGRYEMKIAPKSDLHRSEIWAKHCGVNLTKFNMHINLTDDEKLWGKSQLQKISDKPIVLISPISAMGIKDLSDIILMNTTNYLINKGYTVVGLHKNPIDVFLKNKIPCLFNVKLRQWMSLIYAADYIISVDSAAFHCAGGMYKPVVGIFTFANGNTYGKHYPTAMIVQGPCPFGMSGCYNWGICPKENKNAMLPCHSGLNSDLIISRFENLVKKYPIA